MANLPLTFVHLSDIHLGTPGMHGVCDLNAQLRGALEQDLVEFRETNGCVTGLLVTGDIAFSGAEAQYLEAGDWLTKLCKIAGCDEDQVWIVPGNHDVQRSVNASSMLVRDFHTNVRQLPPSQLDAKLGEALTDAVASKGIFDALANYNAFACRFRCTVSAVKPFWEKDLLLNDGSILRLRGVTSTLISDATDDDKANKLLLGTAQLSIVREPGVEYLVLCHHPPEWLLDRDAIEQKLCALVRVQLFGHKHEQTIHQIDQNLRLTSGAIHPERHGQVWVPRFNVLSLQVEGSGNQRTMKVDVHSRIWDAPNQIFMADGRAEQYQLALNRWGGRPASGAVGVPAVVPPRPMGSPAPTPCAVTPSVDDLLRKLTYRFLTLSILNRMDVLDRLGLLPTRELGSIDAAFYSAAISRLQADGRLSECWDTINRVVRSPEPNPFSEAARRSVNANA